ncbi:hypothetical protein [Metabacillus arenae]|uniref:Uncharacterized protein n=1 Tax=Metabacillus arenae TaxID=2771434 RepID=A0A926NIY2_9BACI|nr:hypothetical protein [Metabacillus arenae]MBD1381615.1 hypothetical protein [Metabacillus arenae]
MFDPTAYDNLKVILEGAVYDLDLHKVIQVINRRDLVDLASMSRHYQINFCLPFDKKIVVQLDLRMELEQLAGELLRSNQTPGCIILITFFVKEKSIDSNTKIIETLRNMWVDAADVRHSVTVVSNSHLHDHHYQIDFQRKITESNSFDIENLVEHVVLTLQKLPIND